MDFWISDWISGFHSGFLDFWISVWISADGVRDFFREDPLDTGQTNGSMDKVAMGAVGVQGVRQN